MPTRRDAPALAPKTAPPVTPAQCPAVRMARGATRVPEQSSVPLASTSATTAGSPESAVPPVMAVSSLDAGGEAAPHAPNSAAHAATSANLGSRVRRMNDVEAEEEH